MPDKIPQRETEKISRHPKILHINQDICFVISRAYLFQIKKLSYRALNMSLNT